METDDDTEDAPRSSRYHVRGRVVRQQVRRQAERPDSQCLVSK